MNLKPRKKMNFVFSDERCHLYSHGFEDTERSDKVYCLRTPIIFMYHPLTLTFFYFMFWLYPWSNYSVYWHVKRSSLHWAMPSAAHHLFVLSSLHISPWKEMRGHSTRSILDCSIIQAYDWYSNDNIPSLSFYKTHFPLILLCTEKKRLWYFLDYSTLMTYY